MPYRGDYDNRLGSDGDFQQRVLLAMTKAALTVYAENPATAGHAARAALAKQVLQAPDTWVRPFTVVLAASVAFHTDASLDAGCASVWNAMAGV